MARKLLLDGYHGKGDDLYAIIDDEDYDEFGDDNWAASCLVSDPGDDLLRIRFVYYVDPYDNMNRYLHREVWDRHRGIPEDEDHEWYVGFLDRNPLNCQLSNLYAWKNGPGNKRRARRERLEELHRRGFDVSHVTKMFDGMPAHKKKYDSAFSSEAVARTMVDPETFEIPAGAPESIKAIRCVTGTLVYVDEIHYEDLAQYNWRDTGERIIRGTMGEIQRLGQIVLGSEEHLIIGYVDRDHTHCWRDNLFAYEKGLANRRAARREALMKLAQNSK